MWDLIWKLYILHTCLHMLFCFMYIKNEQINICIVIVILVFSLDRITPAGVDVGRACLRRKIIFYVLVTHFSQLEA